MSTDQKECKKDPTIEIDDKPNAVTFSKEKSDLHREFLDNIEETLSLKDHMLRPLPEWEAKDIANLLKLLEFITEGWLLDGDLQNIANSRHVDIDRVESVYHGLKSLHPMASELKSAGMFAAAIIPQCGK
jgi:DNA-directed RNA polymerase specialized sigma54-like protein